MSIPKLAEWPLQREAIDFAWPKPWSQKMETVF